MGIIVLAIAIIIIFGIIGTLYLRMYLQKKEKLYLAILLIAYSVMIVGIILLILIAISFEPLGVPN